MDTQAGAQISRKAFIQSAVILLALILIAGILTKVVPTGEYQRVEMDDRVQVVPGSYQAVDPPNYPIWRWFTAPVEVLGGPDSLIVIVIIFFILFVGSAFAVLDEAGILESVISGIVKRFDQRRRVLLAIISLFFMLLGSVFGIFEEVIPLVPLMVALAYSLGWDSLVGLGMSVLAVNLGFSAAIANPFTIGVAQELSDLPLFSGLWLRIPIFLVVYGILLVFLLDYTRRIEEDPSRSLVYAVDQSLRRKASEARIEVAVNKRHRAAVTWFVVFVMLILLALIVGSRLPAISDFLLPIAGIFFLIGGVGAGIIASGQIGRPLRAAWSGILGIAPGIPLILMAMSVKHIIASGEVLDTILYQASGWFEGVSPLAAAVMVLGLTLIIEVFVASASAKAFLLMPILVPLADLIGLTRQTTVLAYAFGDGFSNMAYPTNAALLICLGLTVVSFPTWIRWTAKLWFWLLLVSLAGLGLAVAVNYGPF
jgi:uncharacterized ion transporter superfamily protein YfcC